MERDICRVLIVDDSENIHEDIKHILNPHKIMFRSPEVLRLKDELFGNGDVNGNENVDELLSIQYNIDDAYQGEEAIKLVKKADEEAYPFSLVFMDVRMPPGMDGIQAIENIWQIDPHIEVVICTAYSDYTWEKIVAKFGHNNHVLFVKKPFDSVSIKQITLTLTTKWKLDKLNREHIINLETEVKKRTRELKVTVEKLTREVYLRKEKENELAYLAHFDSLTGLLNRHSFYNSIDGITNRSRSDNKNPFSLLFIDMDEFKQANDIYGHDLGDSLLVEISKRIKSCLAPYARRLSDFSSEKVINPPAVFRLGGDEFTAILALENRNEISNIADRLVKSVNQPYFLNSNEIRISCSVGISLYPTDSKDARTLLKYADLAMYKSKESKNTYLFHKTT